jgi:hypothetical protein
VLCSGLKEDFEEIRRRKSPKEKRAIRLMD